MGRFGRLALFALACVLSIAGGAGTRYSLALFADTETTAAAFDSQDIFSGERVTPAFEVADHSSATATDGSSPFAFDSDGRTAATSPWAAAFAADRYLEFDLNHPLPGGLAISSASFMLRFASGAADSTGCYYFEVRRLSTAEVLATHGSGSNPVACVTGTVFSTGTTAIPSVDSTDLANDLRIRVFGRDSGGNAMVVDQAVVSGSTAYAAFTLYPVLFVDAADSTAVATPWDLSGL